MRPSLSLTVTLRESLLLMILHRRRCTPVILDAAPPRRAAPRANARRASAQQDLKRVIGAHLIHVLEAAVGGERDDVNYEDARRAAAEAQKMEKEGADSAADP